MSPRQRKTSKHRAAGTPAATQDPPDNCVALQPRSSLPSHDGDRSSAPPSGRLTALEIVYKHPNQLKPRRNNPRTHNKSQISQIVSSITEFEFVNPVLIDGTNGIVAGHARVEAAKLLGMTDVPTVRVDHLTPAQLRAYVIADNKLAELADWNPEQLALEFQELSVELNFDVTLTGFETAEVDLLINELKGGKQDQADNVPPVDRSAAAVARQDDIWRIGDHVLCCGDALSSASYRRLLGERKAQLVFVDVSGLASGELTAQEYINSLKTVFTHLAACSVNGSIHYICNHWRHNGEVLQAASTIYSEQKNLCVWSKTNAETGSLYRSQHELIFVFKNGTAAHINNMKLGRFGRYRTDVWSYPGAKKRLGKRRDAKIAMHPTVKPLALVADAILDCSRRGDIILDAFAGVGTTLIAAEQTGRRGYGIEIDPHCVDTAIRRLATKCGLKAIHAESKLSFDQLKNERRGGRHHG